MISLIIIPGIIGAIFSTFERAHTANVIWSFSNLIMAWHTYQLGDMDSTQSYLAFWLFAVGGVIRHMYNSHKSSFLTVRLLNQNVYITSTRCIS